jgi:hypothetical protein
MLDHGPSRKMAVMALEHVWFDEPLMLDHGPSRKMPVHQVHEPTSWNPFVFVVRVVWDGPSPAPCHLRNETAWINDETLVLIMAMSKQGLKGYLGSGSCGVAWPLPQTCPCLQRPNGPFDCPG